MITVHKIITPDSSKSELKTKEVTINPNHIVKFEDCQDFDIAVMTQKLGLEKMRHLISEYTNLRNPILSTPQNIMAIMKQKREYLSAANR